MFDQLIKFVKNIGPPLIYTGEIETVQIDSNPWQPVQKNNGLNKSISFVEVQTSGM